jgi:hypothetical protein
MSSSFKSRQRGLSFIGLVLVGALLAGTGALIAQVIPTAMEYQAIMKAVKRSSEGSTVQDVRTIFDKASSIDNISSITGKDLEVTKEGDKVVVSFAYEREIHMFGPAYLTIKYVGKSN